MRQREGLVVARNEETHLIFRYADRIAHVYRGLCSQIVNVCRLRQCFRQSIDDQLMDQSCHLRTMRSAEFQSVVDGL